MLKSPLSYVPVLKILIAGNVEINISKKNKLIFRFGKMNLLNNKPLININEEIMLTMIILYGSSMMI